MDAINVWRSSMGTRESATDVEVIAGILKGCHQLLSLLLTKAPKVEATRVYRQILERGRATLFFLDQEFDVSSGHLDKLLQRSEQTLELTLGIFISFADFLRNDVLKTALPNSEDYRDILQSSAIDMFIERARGIIEDFDEPDREVLLSTEELYATLDANLNLLDELGPALENPVLDYVEPEKANTSILHQDRYPYQYYAELIRIKFPSASTAVVDMHGQYNWKRYNRIQKEREANALKKQSLKPAGNSETQSIFHDSGIGTSVPAQSVYAETVLSKRAENSHVALPPLPKVGREGKPFTCEICNATLNITRTHAWKKHVFQDILAYICPYTDCPDERGFFQDQDTMAAHLGLRHGLAPEWESQKCPLCLEHTGRGKNLISLHFARHMEEIALGALPRPDLQDSSSSSGSSSYSSSNKADSIGDATSSQKNELLIDGASEDLATPISKFYEQQRLQYHLREYGELPKLEMNQPRRIDIACTRCRRRKVRCDSKRPQCGLCLRAQVECEYVRVVQPYREQEHEASGGGTHIRLAEQTSDDTTQQHLGANNQGEKNSKDLHTRTKPITAGSSQYFQPHPEDASLLPTPVVKDEQKDGEGIQHRKYEERSQSMITWWAERKARQEEENKLHLTSSPNPNPNPNAERSINSVGLSALSAEERHAHIPPSTNGLPNYTRTSRISAAKKGLKVHNCDQCDRSYTRAEHLRRHQKNHPDTPLQCKLPGCGKLFYRVDLLQRHQDRHSEIDSNNDGEDSQTTATRDPLERWLNERPSTEPFLSYTSFTAHNDAQQNAPNIPFNNLTPDSGYGTTSPDMLQDIIFAYQSPGDFK